MTDAPPDKSTPPDPQFEREQAYLAAAQAGDYDAFGALCELLMPALRRYAVRLIGQRDEVDDVLQLALISLHRHLHRVDPPSNLRAYAYRIVRNRCYDVLRSGGRTVSLDDEPLDLWVSFVEAGSVPAADDTAYWLLLHLEVRDAIDRLPPAQRDTLILYAEEGFSYAEIAASMGVTMGTVKSRLFHARAGLRARLRPETLAALDDEFSDGRRVTDTEREDDREREHHGRDDGETSRKSADGAAGAGEIRRKGVSQRRNARNGRSGRARIPRPAQPGVGAVGR